MKQLFQYGVREMVARGDKIYISLTGIQLVVINCFSKFFWALPLKNKTGKEVSKGMETVLKQQTPKKLQTDARLELFQSKL
ncbi:unnamed protein product [Callosobruchus maculatus]|uniref:Uncharacterized protein n=1 Tax=Callosobruchus maculatus TaxID=64391 RepID=A0A653DDG1_CALMS|nr:unnamed protein product [Callosobruchus maculatus]